jgi:hypothetical protein
MMSEEDIKRVNETYARNGLEQDPIEDIVATFKGLIAFMFVVVGLTMLAFAIWGK